MPVLSLGRDTASVNYLLEDFSENYRQCGQVGSSGQARTRREAAEDADPKATEE